MASTEETPSDPNKEMDAEEPNQEWATDEPSKEDWAADEPAEEPAEEPVKETAVGGDDKGGAQVAADEEA